MPAMVGWHLLWGSIVATDAQLEVESPIRKLEEELKLEKGMWLSTTLLALGMVTRWESRIISQRTQSAILLGLRSGCL